jgi:15-cis-phytoene synthase
MSTPIAEADAAQEDARSQDDSYRVARQWCRQRVPDLFFASHFLDRGRRRAAYHLFAVYQQLHEILAEPTACTDAQSCELDAAASGCATPEACASGCAAGAESPGVRRSVCSAVLEHLYAGQPTGRPELDGFAAAAQAYGLSRDRFETLCDGLAAEAGVKRYATWQRLHEDLNRSAGSAAMLVWQVLTGPGKADSGATVEHQVIAAGVAMRMGVVLCRVPLDWRAGRLLLPLYDLVKFGLSERDVAQFTEAGGCQADVRWSELMAFQIERVRNLYRGAARSLTELHDDGARRAAAATAAMFSSMMDRLEQADGDPFAAQIHNSNWNRLTSMPRAFRLVMNPQRAAELF